MLTIHYKFMYLCFLLQEIYIQLKYIHQNPFTVLLLHKEANIVIQFHTANNDKENYMFKL